MSTERPQSWRRGWALAWRQRRVAALATLFIFVWWLIPPLLYRHSGGGQDARLKAITDTRTALLAGLLGVGALLTFWLNSRVYQITSRTLELTEQGHIAERYTKAIEQLGGEELAVRLGGIYALERLAYDSPDRHHPTVVEVLSAFVRERSEREGALRRSQESAEKTDADSRPLQPPWAPTSGARAKQRQPATDIQATLTVLGRLPQRPNVRRGDLRGAYLAGANLGGANLSGAWIDDVNLSGAHLIGANLSGAHLIGANLSGARLTVANMSRALLANADLSSAELAGANLSGAMLVDADLSGAQLSDKDLVDRLFVMASLSGLQLNDKDLKGPLLTGTAVLSGALLIGANLKEAVDLTQEQVDSAMGNATTRLPDALRHPGSWSAEQDPEAVSPWPDR
jgi:uncharacterized protein YjbI with pentapeptide repeats